MSDDPLLVWGLRQVELVDQAVLNPYFTSLAEPLSDYTFSQIFSWRNSLRILWKQMHGHLCIFANGTGDLTLLTPPIGDGDSDRVLSAAFELMDDYNAVHGVPDRSRVEYASEELLARFSRRGLIVQPMGTDYVYDANRMIDLAGGDLASKRQGKNRFMRNYEYRVETYSAVKHMEECRRLLGLWKNHQDAQHVGDFRASALKRQKESAAVELSLQYAEELGLKGMVVYVGEEKGQGGRGEGLEARDGGQAGNDNASDAPSSLLTPHPLPLAPSPSSLLGFTFGEALGRDQSSITIEKTDLRIKGLAQFIFSEFCRTQWSDRPLVNVGDDWGLETLAWTKMSYRPVKLLQKYTLQKVRSVRISTSSPTAPTEIRAARKPDLAAAVELEQNCFSAYCLSKRQLQYLQTRPSAVFLVAEHDGKVIGEGIALVRQHKKGLSGRIYSLAVDNQWRKQKIGCKLLSAMIEQLTHRGVKRIFLEVEQTNAAAIKLYEQSGFRSIGQLPNYYGDDKNALHMMHEINAEALLFQPVGA